MLHFLCCGHNASNLATVQRRSERGGRAAQGRIDSFHAKIIPTPAKQSKSCMTTRWHIIIIIFFFTHVQILNLANLENPDAHEARACAKVGCMSLHGARWTSFRKPSSPIVQISYLQQIPPFDSNKLPRPNFETMLILQFNPTSR